MSLTAHRISTLIAALALCLAIHPPRSVSGQNALPPAKQGDSTIRGVVTYADTGRPIRYAEVRLISDETGSWAAEGVTNRRGEFAIEHVAAGHYVIFVDSLGLLEPPIPEKGQGSAIARLRLSGQTFTEVVVNGTDSVDLKVQAVRGGVITGRVVTEDDQPLAKAEIKLLKRENGKWAPVGQAWNQYSSDKHLTDPSGVYRVAGLVAGEYLVRVSEGIVGFDRISQQEEGAYSNGFLMTAYYPAATTIGDLQAVTVIEGSESTGIDIRMPERAAHKISGTLKFGPENEPCASAEVLIERKDETGYTDPELGAIARTDPEGKWEVEGVPAGEYSVRFGGIVRVGPSDAGSHVIVAPKRISVRVEHDDVVVPDTKLSEGSSISGKLTLDGKPPKNFFQIHPRAIPQGRPSAVANSASDPRGGLAVDIPSGFVRADGTFGIHGLQAGKYSITVWGYEAGEYYVKSVTRKGVDLMQSSLKVGEESDVEDVVIALATDFATVEGQLTRPQASPKLDLRDVVVILAPANDATRRFKRGLITAQPDARGKFVVNCPPGEYFLTAVSSTEIKKLAKPITEDYFKEDHQKFERVKVKAGEKLKDLNLRVGAN